MFHLNDFERHVSLAVQKRGYTYYLHGAVLELEEKETGYWAATVSGSEDYEVSVQMKDFNVRQYYCDCPYEDEDLCKHLVAVLYKIREELPKKTPAKAKKASFEDLLQQLSLEELRDFIRKHKAVYKDMEDRFMLHFADKNPDLDIHKKYDKILQKLIRTHSGQGYMTYRDTYKFVQALAPILASAHQAIADNKLRIAIAIGDVLIARGMELIKMADDSAGNIGGLLQDAIQIFKSIAEKEGLPKNIKLLLFDWVEETLTEKDWFNYGDYGDELVQLALMLATDVGEDRYLALLDSLTTLHLGSTYTSSYLIRKKVSYLQAIGRDKVAKQLQTASMEIVEIRSEVVEKAIAAADYTYAKNLITEGIQLANKQRHPGTVAKWERKLLRIAELEKDLESFRLLTKKFAFGYTLDLTYYQLWKSSFTKKEWPAVIEQYIRSVIDQEMAEANIADETILADNLYRRLGPIYLEESRWLALLDLVAASPSLKKLAKVYPYLAKEYPTELLAMCLPLFKQAGAKASSRPDYEQLATWMKKIIQEIPQSRESIHDLAAQLIAAYRNRPAMVGELKKVLES